MIEKQRRVPETEYGGCFLLVEGLFSNHLTVFQLEAAMRIAHSILASLIVPLFSFSVFNFSLAY